MLTRPSKAPPRLFGTNGIRGVVGKEVNADFSYRLGSSTGLLFKPGPVAVGRDGRTSGMMLCEGVVSGILSQGCDVTDYALTTTPALQFLVKNGKGAGGVMVTASHNPPEYNGFKVIASDGVEVSRKLEAKIEFLVERNTWKLGKKPGRRVKPIDGLNPYFNGLRTQAQEIPEKLHHIKAVVDVGNGVAALTTPKILRDLGCSVFGVNDNIDGRFPGRLSEPRPENLATLSGMVQQVGADFGVAHDGDGDRAIFADEKGTIQWGDRSFALVVDEVLKNKPGAKVVTPLNSSMAVGEIVKKRHGRLILTKVGSVEVSRTMIRAGAVIGGEENGGIFYAPHHPVRDGTMAVLLVLKALVRNKVSLSTLMNRLPRFVMAKEKFDCRNESSRVKAIAWLKKQLGTRVTSTLDGVKVDVKNRGWVLIRPSGTEPLVRLYAEGVTEKDLSGLLDEFKPMIQRALKV
ncbi:phosphoglucosamine mutase [archaeon 13_1_20CM_2_54_9]|nr:MAG: phosphoglucosamine mutase [archaeon 13_1_20CM_2_54_9]